MLLPYLKLIPLNEVTANFQGPGPMPSSIRKRLLVLPPLVGIRSLTAVAFRVLAGSVSEALSFQPPLLHQFGHMVLCLWK